MRRQTWIRRIGRKVFIIIAIMILIAMILTWLVPAGAYDRIMDKATGKEIIDPDSFHYIKSTAVTPFQMFVCVEQGLIGAANITFLIFSAFAALHALEVCGAIDAAVAIMVRRTQKHPNSAWFFLIAIMVILAVWGSTGTISYEEMVAFVPIFVSVAMALGYDPLVGLGISIVPVGVGFASATVNPFTIGVAQTIAELPLFSGIWLRWIVLIVMVTVIIIYVMIYALRIRKNPEKSLMYGQDMAEFQFDEERLNTPMTPSRILSLLSLLAVVGFMAWGLLTQGWYIDQVSALFMILAVAVGIFNKWTPNQFAKIYIEGLSKGTFSALIVGYGKSILTVFQAGNIIDTIIHAFVMAIKGLSLYASGVGMLIFQTLLNFLIPSGSGQAAVSMPIMTPIADLIGMNRQIAVLIFQFGDGFSNLIVPTGFMFIACVAAKIPIGKYYKWIMPFFGICFLIQIVFVFIAIKVNYM